MMAHHKLLNQFQSAALHVNQIILGRMEQEKEEILEFKVTDAKILIIIS
ncbi:hypothetical protein [Candidatus Harpocratesius sp.]